VGKVGPPESRTILVQSQPLVPEQFRELVGKWKDNGSGPGVEASVDWTKNQHFLRRSIKVNREDNDPLEATEVIGYDAANDKIRSWVFDSDGGFAEGSWKQEGNKWLINFTSTSLDGTTASAQHVVTHIDDKKFTWESINRQSGREVLPNIDKIEVVRVARAISSTDFTVMNRKLILVGAILTAMTLEPVCWAKGGWRWRRPS
jgi:hypothetical protein